MALLPGSRRAEDDSVTMGYPHLPPGDPAMTTPPAPLPPDAPLPALREHACLLIYPVRGLSWPASADFTLGDLADQQATLADGAEGRWLTPEALASITDRARAEPVWVPGGLVPGRDLYDQVRALLGANDGAEAPALGQVWHLGERAARLLHGRRVANPPGLSEADRRPRHLGLRLRPAAQRRLARHLPGFSAPALGLAVEDLWRVAFRTGHGLLVARVRVLAPADQPLHPALLVEALYALSRFNETRWYAAGPDFDAPVGPVFTLGHLVRSLHGDLPRGRQAERVYTATYLQFGETPPPAALQRLLIQLARHYTDEYRTGHDPAGTPGVATLRPFANVTHCLALEGSATVVDLGDDPPAAAPTFLTQYLRSTWMPHYLPLLLVACHEREYLRLATSSACRWHQAARPDGLFAMRQALAGFQLSFRFGQVSHIGMHNQFYAALRHIMGLAVLLQELDRDSAALDAILTRAAAQRAEAAARAQARAFAWASALGTFGLAWLATITVLRESVRALVGVLPEAWVPEHPGIALLALLVAAVAALIHWRRAVQRLNAADAFNQEALRNQIVDQNLSDQNPG